MKKFCILIFVFILTVLHVYSDEIKLYDEYGNRIGTYKKEGKVYVLYDFFDRKVEDPSILINDAPDQSTLSLYSQKFRVIDESKAESIPFFRTQNQFSRFGRGFIQPECWYTNTKPYIIRPKAKNKF